MAQPGARVAAALRVHQISRAVAAPMARALHCAPGSAAAAARLQIAAAAMQKYWVPSRSLRHSNDWVCLPWAYPLTSRVCVRYQ